MSWMVAVPDYTAQIGTPGGGHSYGFAGVNAMRGVFAWLGMAIAPLSCARRHHTPLCLNGRTGAA